MAEGLLKQIKNLPEDAYTPLTETRIKTLLSDVFSSRPDDAPLSVIITIKDGTDLQKFMQNCVDSKQPLSKKKLRKFHRLLRRYPK